ncbi:hypothetical protein MKX01_023374 [Papaver californicum]|nr:hypothetical protein MKX01_023374 [Papaver californicum]
MAVEVAKLGFLSNTCHHPALSPHRNNNHFSYSNVINTSSRRIRKRRSLYFSRQISGSLIKDEEDQRQVLFTEPETQLIEALIGIQERGRSASSQQLKEVERAVQSLEGQEGVPDPRTFVGVDGFSVFQEVYLKTDDPRVSNIVKFSEAIGELKVEAAVSVKDGTCILFRFDRTAFSFSFLPFKVPYPVPFKLLGEEAKGWLDTAYLPQSGNIRISRGNKGTTFVLQKETAPRQKLLATISTGVGVKEAVEKFVALNQRVASIEPELQVGIWQLIWSSQQETDRWIENAANGLMGKQTVKESGQLRFVVDILLGMRFSMDGNFVKSGNNTYDVTMDDAAIIAGSFGLPMEMITKFKLELLYIDNKIQITRGYNKILFVHLRVDDFQRK